MLHEVSYCIYTLINALPNSSLHMVFFLFTLFAYITIMFKYVPWFSLFTKILDKILYKHKENLFLYATVNLFCCKVLYI